MHVTEMSRRDIEELRRKGAAHIHEWIKLNCPSALRQRILHVMKDKPIHEWPFILHVAYEFDVDPQIIFDNALVYHEVCDLDADRRREWYEICLKGTLAYPEPISSYCIDLMRKKISHWPLTEKRPIGIRIPVKFIESVERAAR